MLNHVLHNMPSIGKQVEMHETGWWLAMLANGCEQHFLIATALSYLL